MAGVGSRGDTLMSGAKVALHIYQFEHGADAILAGTKQGTPGYLLCACKDASCKFVYRY
jgi:hypothetical protein